MTLDEELAEHDATLAARGFTIWIGAEPTFTRRDAQDPWWLWQAEGGDKEERARALLIAIAERLCPGGRLLRAVGRQFPEEPAPRFAYGALWGIAQSFQAGPRKPFDRSGLDAPAIAPPAVDVTKQGWLTVTPDPGVVEVNMAPVADTTTFLAHARVVHDAAAATGLSPLRWRWNGVETDSGGGGQITLGGPSPTQSPFFQHPAMLPGLLRYLNRHPSLSYWFSTECLGSASQGPRPDEGVRERYEELAVALDRLDARGAAAGAAELWATLAPLLVDCSGNSHRAELNIEKLWNAHLAGRGRLGLVECRALRMQPTPEGMAAIGALLRAVAARVAAVPPPRREAPLVDWGAALHDRFALPAFLRADLDDVLDDLAAHGFGLGSATRALLVAAHPPVARVALGGATLTVTPALEFWPLVGDVASQERSSARLVDSSTERVEVVVSGGPPGRLAANGVRVPLHAMSDGRHIAGVRWRTFVPAPGLHPGLAPVDPLTFTWVQGDAAVSLALHAWIPGGGVYPGLPASAAEAARRRAERVVLAPATGPVPAATAAGAGFTVDLRRL